MQDRNWVSNQLYPYFAEAVNRIYGDWYRTLQLVAVACRTFHYLYRPLLIYLYQPRPIKAASKAGLLEKGHY